MGIELVLFDLDGTLAIPTVGGKITYMVIRGYSEYIAEKLGINPGRIESAVIKSLKSLREGVPGDDTIDKVFLERIAEKIEESMNTLYKHTEKFYDEYFDVYKRYYRQAPHAREVIESLLENNVKVGIATDPIVFLKGVIKRLEWVNLHDLNYCVITAAENSHFVKPQIEFYIETIGKCSTNPQKTLMVGNTYEFDIRPVKKLGGHALYIPFEDDIEEYEEKIESLTEVLDYIKKT